MLAKWHHQEVFQISAELGNTGVYTFVSLCLSVTLLQENNTFLLLKTTQ